MPNDTDQARELAAVFAQMCDAVDAYRAQHLAELSSDERDRLEEAVQTLQDVHDDLTATAIQDTLNAIQGDLAQITQLTKQAQAVLAHLNKIADVLRIVSAATELGSDIVAADYGAIPQAIEDLAQALPDQADKNISDAVKP